MVYNSALKFAYYRRIFCIVIQLVKCKFSCPSKRASINWIGIKPPFKGQQRYFIEVLSAWRGKGLHGEELRVIFLYVLSTTLPFILAKVLSTLLALSLYLLQSHSMVELLTLFGTSIGIEVKLKPTSEGCFN